MSEIKTKITDLLDAHNIPYRVLAHREPAFTVETAVAQRGIPKEEMIKSILLREKKNPRYVMACVTGDERLDPKAVRARLPDDWKRLVFASAEEIQQITGCVQGAVAPLGLPSEVPIVFDETIADCARVNISSGDPRAGLELSPQDLIKLAGAQLAPIAESQRN